MASTIVEPAVTQSGVIVMSANTPGIYHGALRWSNADSRVDASTYRFGCALCSHSYLNSSMLKPAPSMILFRVPIGIGLLPWTGTIT